MDRIGANFLVLGYLLLAGCGRADRDNASSTPDVVLSKSKDSGAEKHVPEKDKMKAVDGDRAINLPEPTGLDIMRATGARDAIKVTSRVPLAWRAFIESSNPDTKDAADLPHGGIIAQGGKTGSLVFVVGPEMVNDKEIYFPVYRCRTSRGPGDGALSVDRGLPLRLRLPLGERGGYHHFFGKLDRELDPEPGKVATICQFVYAEFARRDEKILNEINFSGDPWKGIKPLPKVNPREMVISRFTLQVMYLDPKELARYPREQDLETIEEIRRFWWTNDYFGEAKAPLK